MSGCVRSSRTAVSGIVRAWSACTCLLLVALAGCAEERVSEVTLDQLVGAPAEFDGERVRTRGVVQSFDDPEHYWIETNPRNRLAVSPESAVVDHVGEPVVVVGRFTWHPERGRRLELDSVLPSKDF
jgi:hypothetical protein